MASLMSTVDAMEKRVEGEVEEERRRGRREYGNALHTHLLIEWISIGFSSVLR
jgi:hypothetical protein